MNRCDIFDCNCINEQGERCPLYYESFVRCLLMAASPDDACIVAVPNGPYEFKNGEAVPLAQVEQTEQVNVEKAAAEMVLNWFDDRGLTLSDSASLGYIIGRCEQILASREGKKEDE